ncbi:MAG TPA: ZIP family metal transporter [Candidatus Saccharimonadales bacterium]|nr:ZIP family metal transporter [Candidatus Saccharimonadales bacterium]
MIVFLLTIAASIAALLGGLTALRSRQWLNLALALTAGLVLGLVAFDLLPEIFDIAQSKHLDTVWPMVTLVSGFLLFHILEKFIPVHEASEEQYLPHRHPRLGTARAVALSGHSFLDGLSIGVAFQVSTAVGTAVALAVIGHRFADGFDATTFMVFHRNKLSHIKVWLSVVVLMPILGGLLSLIYDFPETALALYLGFFAGFILYIAASNLLPQAHSQEFSRKSILLTIFGTIFMFIVTRFV